MRRWNDAACVARTSDGKACGLPPRFHAVQRRRRIDPLTVGHGFVFAQGSTVNPKNSRADILTEFLSLLGR